MDKEGLQKRKIPENKNIIFIFTVYLQKEKIKKSLISTLFEIKCLIHYEGNKIFIDSILPTFGNGNVWSVQRKGHNSMGEGKR